MIIANSSSDNNDNTKPPLTLTVSHIDPNVQSQQEIDAAVKSSVHNGISLYNLNDSALTDSKPTVILTQSLCDVCAVAKDEVDTEVMCNFTPGQCKVISLEPHPKIFDYLLKTRVSDMSAYRRLLGETLLKLPSISDTRTYVVMEEVKQTNKVALYNLG